MNSDAPRPPATEGADTEKAIVEGIRLQRDAAGENAGDFYADELPHVPRGLVYRIAQYGFDLGYGARIEMERFEAQWQAPPITAVERAALDLIHEVITDLEDSNGVARPACLTLARQLREALGLLRPATPREGGADALRAFVARIASTRCDHGGEECEEWIHAARALMGRTPRDHADGEE